MLNHSANIKAVGGILAVRNLNVFPEADLDYLDVHAAFREAARRASILAERAMDPEWGEGDKASLLELSVPRLKPLGAERYALTGGILYFAGMLFSPGAVFGFSDTGLVVETPDLIEAATAVPTKMSLMTYDTYNASRLGEISDDVLRELGVSLDKDALAYAYAEEGEDVKTWDEIEDGDMTGLSQVKYVSVYAEGLTAGAVGRAIAYVPIGTDYSGGRAVRPTDGLGFDDSYFKEVEDYKTYYDRFLVEFVDKSQPFAYIAVEAMGGTVLGAGEDSEDMPVRDFFADQFSGESKDEFVGHDKAEIVDTLKRIAAGEV